MPTPQEIHQLLTSNSLFKKWLQHHENTYLTHFFSTLNSAVEMKQPWEVGFYDAAREKMTVFLPLENDDFEIKPEDDVFKSGGAIEKLSLDLVNISFSQAVAMFKQQFPLSFPKEQISDGFVILQKVEGKVMWNFAFMTKSIQYLNLKIDAQEGGIIASQLIAVAQRE